MKIQLTESQLHNIIKESVKKILSEERNWDEYDKASSEQLEQEISDNSLGRKIFKKNGKVRSGYKKDGRLNISKLDNDINDNLYGKYNKKPLNRKGSLNRSIS